MIHNHLTRHIRLAATENDSRHLEQFIEQICDDYHIYDAYYGNILAANTITFEILRKLQKEKGTTIDVYFNSSPEGLFFTMQLKKHFLDIARLYEKVRSKDPDDPSAYSGELQPMMMIRMLTDEINLDPDEESITLTFHVTGINELLSLQRIQLLEKYYADLVKVQKA